MKEHPIKVPRKLIEVALPLDAINSASAAEKTIRQGHPSSLHLWWARRPLVSARAMIFAQMVNDPGYQQGKGFKYGVNKKEAAAERKRLFKILEELVQWDRSDDVDLLARAKQEIVRSWKEVCELNKNHPRAKELFDPNSLPPLHDPFAGGGAIPFEGQRLGLDVFATDLNPVPVLINKSMIEIPQRFNACSPVNPCSVSDRQLLQRESHGLSGLASDLAYYGERVRKAVSSKLNAFYPDVLITPDLAATRPDLEGFVGDRLPVIAWIWARTVPSPNPAFANTPVPLASTFVLSKKKGAEAYLEPVINGREYTFNVRIGQPTEEAKKGTKTSKGTFRCILSGTPISAAQVRELAQKGKMSERLLAIVAKTRAGRLYLPPVDAQEVTALSVCPEQKPEVSFFTEALGFRVGNYGMTRWDQLFTNRQLAALSAFAEAIREVRDEVVSDALAAKSLPSDDRPLREGGAGPRAYSEAIRVYLTFALDKLADLANSLCGWEPIAQCPRHLFGRQAIPIVWDFAEGNPLGDSSGSWKKCLDGIARAVEKCLSTCAGSTGKGRAFQADASNSNVVEGKVICTDPPYYDNIGYADLSDFFYVWQRQTLREVFPELYSTISTPKSEELVATPARHGGKGQAEKFFVDGMTSVMSGIASRSHPAFPTVIYYAFKQSETSAVEGTSSTGWVTFLDAVLNSGFSVVGTWPVRTENASRLRGQTSNALASSVVLVCQRREAEAPSIPRRDFIRELNSVLPEALDDMTRGNGGEQSPVAPVDLSQAIIGPGMAVFSKYSAVLEADGTPMSVKSALQIINRFLAEDDFDSDTQFCLHWFEEHGWDSDAFGTADVLARAKATSVSGLAEAGVIQSGGGKVRLLKWTEYPSDWDPQSDFRTPVWEALHHLIRALKQGGESAAGKVLEGVASKAEASRQLAYRLYTLCERKGWAEDARAYNELITSWSSIESAAPKVEQRELF